MKTKTCILIPSYNEERAIGGIIRALRGRSFTVYVVDDGSTDRTAEIAAAEGAVVVQHKVNKGKGASLREGFNHILKKGFDTVIIMDGDDQHEVDDIDAFITCMEETGSDMVIGNRMNDTGPMPSQRIWTNRLMSGLISMIIRQKVPDTQCGFRLIKARVLESIKLESSNYEIESEMIIKAAKRGYRIESVSIKTIYEDQKSRIHPVFDTLRFFLFLIRVSLKP